MPAEYGSTTPSAAAVATAASTALPPALSTSMPACEAYGLTLDTAPPDPTATGDRGGCGSEGAGLPQAAASVAKHTTASRVLPIVTMAPPRADQPRRFSGPVPVLSPRPRAPRALIRASATKSA